jgi:hypothetical protein
LYEVVVIATSALQGQQRTQLVLALLDHERAEYMEDSKQYAAAKMG